MCVRVCYRNTRNVLFKKKSIYFYIFYSVFKIKYRSEKRKIDVCPCTSVCILHGSCWRTVITNPRAAVPIVTAGMRQTISYIIHALTIVSPPRCLWSFARVPCLFLSFRIFPPLFTRSLRPSRAAAGDGHAVVRVYSSYLFIYFIFNNSNSS